MKTRSVLIAFLMGLAACTAQAQWIYYDVNETIPDNDPVGLQDTRTVSGFTDLIQSIQVRLLITALPSDWAYNGDYYISLQHGSGFSVLLNRVGRTTTEPLGYWDNGLDITLSSDGEDIHNYQTFAPVMGADWELTGNWDADGRNVDPDNVLDTDSRTALLDVFNGLDPNGEWTLFVADLNLNGNATQVQWGLNISVVPEPSSVVLLLVGAISVLLRMRMRRPY